MDAQKVKKKKDKGKQKNKGDASKGDKENKDKKDKGEKKKKDIIRLHPNGKLQAGTIEAIVSYLLEHSVPPPVGRKSIFVSNQRTVSPTQI